MYFTKKVNKGLKNGAYKKRLTSYSFILILSRAESTKFARFNSSYLKMSVFSFKNVQ